MAAFDRMSIFRYFVLGLSDRLLASSCFSLSLSLSLFLSRQKIHSFTSRLIGWSGILLCRKRDK